MTTAHRPTFDPARGKEAARGEAYHQRLLPAHKTLKYRQQGQGTASEQAKRDLRAELLKNEAEYFAKKDGDRGRENSPEAEDEPPLAIEDSKASVAVKRKFSDTASEEGNTSDKEGGEGEEGEDYEAKKRRILAETRAIDASDSESGSSSESSDESDSDDEDQSETAALMAELAKVKAERAEQAAKEAAINARREQEERERAIAVANPLLNKQDFSIKRRWNDDVIFKDQARLAEEKEKSQQKTFINDVLRSDFHKRFMSKYIR